MAQEITEQEITAQGHKNATVSRGRPAKKPGYDREAEIDSLINTAVDLAVEPFDESIERDDSLPTLTEIAETMETTLLRVRKLLITADYFTSSISCTVQKLKADGLSISEIMTATGLGKASVYSYLPLTKGAYNLENPTLYSEQGKRYRLRRSAVASLHTAISSIESGEYGEDCSVALWKCVIAFQDYPFKTAGRGKDRAGATKFKYEVSEPGGNSGRKYAGESVEGFGNELWIIIDGKRKDKSISRSTVDLAYKNALELMAADGCVRGPKALGVPGAGSYLYSLFLRFGVIAAGDKG